MLTYNPQTSFPNNESTDVGLGIKPKSTGELPKLLQSLQQSSHLNKLEIDLHDEYDKIGKPQELLQSLGEFKCLTFLKISNASNLLTCVLTFPDTVTELTLSKINCITDEGMNGLGNHTKLKILTLSGTVLDDGDSFDLNCVGGSFPQLEVFEMRNLKLREWKLGNGGMPWLQSVIIRSCTRLDDLPNELWSLNDLRKVQVNYPSEQMTLMLQNLKIKNEVQLVIEC